MRFNYDDMIVMLVMVLGWSPSRMSVFHMPRVDGLLDVWKNLAKDWNMTFFVSGLGFPVQAEWANCTCKGSRLFEIVTKT